MMCHKIRAQNQTWSGYINYNYKKRYSWETNYYFPHLKKDVS